jgi:TonB family protein
LPELVLDWPGLKAPPVGGRALGISVLLHAVGIAALALWPRAEVAPVSYSGGARLGPTLIAPPFELTQTAPNRGKIGKEFSLDNLVPRSQLRAPARIPASAPPAPSLPEPPKVEAGRLQAVPGPPPDAAALPPPPQIQTEEAPKLAFETPPHLRPSGGHGSGRLALPADPIAEAVREAARPGAGGTAVGDYDMATPSGLDRLTQTPTSRRTATALEMISDPMGVDFKPYMIRILATVKRNWLAVVPQTALMGRQGRVQIQFAVNRDGSVPKLVIAMSSGTESLDRAAVTGVSASSPFPPLPADFRGDQVRLQFTFSYNIK